ncbi:MAG TPA: DCC1-like thiol-disulfide oxidoreductase family protein [Bdellovibrionota bacterium]|jgi:predicted DCC family thiol-disulfide oxidoreductase YuxK|nr:DCC1-like thiol-disulfide oxidoreductase family protein [Bdellovibrionota bacterium]
MASSIKFQNPYLLYDGECPFCTSLSEYYKVKKALPGLEIVSLRDAEALKKLNLPADLNFNDGMILVLPDGRVLQGEAAFREINQHTDISGLKDFFIVGANSKKWISSWIYPIMFRLRKLVLWAKKVSPNLDRIDLK